MKERQNDFFYVFFIAKKKTYSLFKSGEEIPGGILRSSKDVFYLNDFYDLLYEKMESTTSYGGIPPQYFRTEKYYTMGPGIDFPLVMNYSSEEQQSSSAEAYPPFTLHASRSTTSYFYFLNGHGDVTYFADANFTPEEVESYEYTPWRVLLTSNNKNNLLYNSKYFDNETGIIANLNNIYKPEIGFTIGKRRAFNQLKKLLRKNYITTRDTQGDIPGKQPGGDRDICFHNCDIEYKDDIEDCKIRYEAWTESCYDTAKGMMDDCFWRDEIFGWFDLDCFEEAFEYLDECMAHTEEELEECYNDAWEEYNDCWNSCL